MPVKDSISSILYRNRRGEDDNTPAYHGLLKLPDGSEYWVLAWTQVRGKPVIELKLIPKWKGSGACD